MVVGAIAGDALGATATAVVGDALTGAVVSGITGGNPLTGALTGGIAGGISSAISSSGGLGNLLGSGASSVTQSASGALQLTGSDLQNLANASGWDLTTAAGQQAAAQSLGVPTSTITSAISDPSGVFSTGATQGAQLANISQAGLGNVLSSNGGLSNTSLLGSLSNIASGMLQSNAISSAAQQEAQAAANANQQQLAMYNENVALTAPYRAAGQAALGTLSAGSQPGGQWNTPFTMSMAQNMPAYQFAEQQGQGAINAAANAGGTQLSSANLENLAQFNQGNAAQYENQAFNQWLAENNQALQSNQYLAGLGSGQTTNTTSLGANTANQTSANTMTSGTQQANASLAQGLVGSSLINTLGGSSLSQNALSGLLNSAT
jgi:hypothetical protein